MPDFQLSYSGEQVNTAIGNGLNAVTTESEQTLTPEQQQVVQKKIGLEQLFSHTAPPIVEEKSGSMVSITDASNQTVVSLVSQIVPVQAGSGDPSPTNVRAISGWGSVEAARTRKNVLPDSARQALPYTANGVTFSDAGNGKISVSGTATKSTTWTLHSRQSGNRAYLPAGTYTISGSEGQTNCPVYYFFYYSQEGDVNSYFMQEFTSLTYPTRTITLEKGCYFGAYILVSSGNTADGTLSPQIEVGTAATAYEPYEAQTIATNLPETVYDGSLDWTTGILTVDCALATFDGSSVVSYGVASTGMPYITLPLPPNMNSNWKLICSSNYKIFVNSPPTNEGGIRVVAGYVYIYDARFTDIDTAKSILDTEKPQAVYEIAEPYTIQLTPQQLPLLKGTNNVWSNSGDTAISYVADTKMYIDGLISSIASSVLNN